MLASTVPSAPNSDTFTLAVVVPEIVDPEIGSERVCIDGKWNDLDQLSGVGWKSRKESAGAGIQARDARHCGQ